MTRWMLTVAVAVCMLGSTGCARMHKLLFRKQAQQLETLQSQVTSLEGERDQLAGNVRDLNLMVAAGAADKDLSRKEAQRLEKLLAQYKEEEERRERDRAELDRALEGLEGIRRILGPEGDVIVMDNEVLFASGRAELSEESQIGLNEVAGYLLNHENLNIRVDGHTDGVPIRASSWKDNYHLAAMRAHAVMVYLMERGVAPDRGFIAGHGANRPRTEPENPEDPMAENRRVEILLIPPSARSGAFGADMFQD